MVHGHVLAPRVRSASRLREEPIDCLGRDDSSPSHHVALKPYTAYTFRAPAPHGRYVRHSPSYPSERLGGGREPHRLLTADFVRVPHAHTSVRLVLRQGSPGMHEHAHTSRKKANGHLERQPSGSNRVHVMSWLFRIWP